MRIPLRTLDVLRRALEEDIGHSDITSEYTIPEDHRSKALFVAKASFVVAGMPFAREVFQILDQEGEFNLFFHEGSPVKKGDIIAGVNGRTRTLLSGERVALNILQRLSGIATMTRSFVDKVKGTNATIVDTRKTAPGLRFMEKYAVRMGGGTNHRFGLFDGILIKDNHIEAAGSIASAVKAARKAYHLSRIEVEVENLKDLEEALKAKADVVMLDNMTIDDMKEAVKAAKGKVLIEASGNITLSTVRAIAETGVDLISVGAMTHSAPAADISMKIVR